MKKVLFVLIIVATALSLVVCSLDDQTSATSTKFYVDKGVPSADTGSDGDLYLDEDASTVYVKTDGTWTSIADLKGTNGTTWTAASGAPSSSTGTDGDLYLDTSTKQVYQKQNGAWVVMFSLATTVWYTGEGLSNAPASPNTGDFYLDILSTMIYKWSGSTWTQLFSFERAQPHFIFTPDSSSYELWGIAFGAGTFVSVGYYLDSSGDSENSSVIIYTSDGTKWDYGTITHSPPAMTSMVPVKASASSLALGAAARRARAKGLGGTESLSSTSYLYSVAYGDGTFIAVGGDSYYSTNYGMILTSTDGVNWSDLSDIDITGYSYFYRVSYANGVFVISGLTLESVPVTFVGKPGGTWTSLSIKTDDVQVATQGAAGDGTTLVSGAWVSDNNYYDGYGGRVCSWNGSSWDVMNPADSGYCGVNSVYGMAYGDGKFIGVGYYIDSKNWQYSQIISSGASVSSTSWASQETPSYYCLNDVAYGPSGFIAVGYNGTLLTSANGVTWDLQTWDNCGFDFTGVAWGTIGGETIYAVSRSAQ